MSARQKSQRGFVAVTLITLLAIAMVIVVYATMLGTFTGGDVTVVSLNGDLWYNEDNSTTWYTSIGNVANGSSWYAKFNTTSSGYQGNVDITWTLQNKTNGSYEDLGVTQQTNNFNLNGNAGQEIYASDNGEQTGNKNWGASTTTAGTYRIKMEVVTA